MGHEILALIRARLGEKTQSFSGAARGKKWIGYRAACGAHDESRARSDAELRTKNVRLYLGDGGRKLYAVPELPPIDVIELMRVGTHNGQEDAWKMVRDLLRETVLPVGFDVVFADEAGLDVRLSRPVDAKTAKKWERALMKRFEAGEDHWMDSVCLMAEEGESIAEFVRTTGSLRFWWD